ncbi:MAG: hypothetical protein LBE13_15415, partial [Bacteroidales bacterium]|nr:hypothetical protein [Bacteroidales bacterium]
ICDSTGDIQERYTYNAFGKRNVFDVDFATKNETEFNWNRDFTGQILDSETGLMLYRNRYYHTELGRFISRDPIAYFSGDVNIYRYCLNIPLSLVDSHGKWIIPVVAIITIITIAVLYEISQGINPRDATINTITNVGSPHVPGSEVVGVIDAAPDLIRIRDIQQSMDVENNITNNPGSDTQQQNDAWEELIRRQQRSCPGN